MFIGAGGERDGRDSEGRRSPEKGGERLDSTLELLNTPDRRGLTEVELATEPTRGEGVERRRSGSRDRSDPGPGSAWLSMTTDAGHLVEWRREEPRRAKRIVDMARRAMRAVDWVDQRFSFQKACGEMRVERGPDGGSGRAQKRRLRLWLAEVRRYLETRRVPLRYWFALLKAWVSLDRSLGKELQRVEEQGDALVEDRVLPRNLEDAYMFLEAWARMSLRAGVEDDGMTLSRVTKCVPLRGESIGDLMVRFKDLVTDHNELTSGMQIGPEEAYRHLVGIIRRDADVARVIPQDLLRRVNGWEEMWRAHGHVVFSSPSRGTRLLGSGQARYDRWPARRAAEGEYRSSGRGQEPVFRKDIRRGDWFCSRGHLNHAIPPKEWCFATGCRERKSRGGLEWPANPGRYTEMEVNDVLARHGRRYAVVTRKPSGRAWTRLSTPERGSPGSASSKGENERLKSHIGHLRDELAQMKGNVERLMKSRGTGPGVGQPGTDK